MNILLSIFVILLLLAFLKGYIDGTTKNGICYKCGGKLVEQGWYDERYWCPNCDKRI